MFEAVVCGSRKHHVRGSQLFDVPQPLELRGVDDSHQQRMELDVAVDRIIEHLSTSKTIIINVIMTIITVQLFITDNSHTKQFFCCLSHLLK